MLLSAGWPPHGFPVLLFVAFVPLFMLGSDRNLKAGDSFIVGFITFFLFHLLSAGWMYSSTFAGSFITHLFNAFVFGVVFLLWTLIARVFSRFSFPIFLVLYLSMEYLHTIWAQAWPWFPLGNGLAENTDWIQWFAFTGVQGGSLWILLFNGLLFKAIIYGVGNERNKFGFILIMLLFLVLVPVFISYQLLDSDRQEPTYTVALVQPNINPRTEKFNGLTEQEQVQRTLKLISATKFDSIRLVIFPETFLTNPIHEDSVIFSTSLHEITERFVEFQKISVMIGAFTKRDSSGAFFDQDVMIRDKNPYVLYNSAILFGENDTYIYHKVKLLPLVEKQLFIYLLQPFRDFIEKSGAYFGSYGTHNEFGTYLVSDGIVVAPVICFESVFGAYTAEKVLQNNADFIVLITNDGWWKSDGGYLQHLAYARLRCIETGKWMVRCANTGVSAIIDNHGTIIQKTNYGEAAVLTGKVGLNNTPPTFYARYGDFIGKYSIISSAILIVLGMFMKIGKDQYFR